MKPDQITIRDLLSIYRRRKKYLFIPAVIVTALSVVGSMVMSNKYESSTTILVQRDEILNPLISYQMAVAMASEDRLRTFNEILYSHTMMQKLRDSLYRSDEESADTDEQSVLEVLRKRITTERRGSDSFRIIFASSDASKAQAAVALLADQFIQTILTVEGQRNESTVKFFQDKLDELRAKFEASQQRVVSAVQSRINILPQDSRELYTQLETVQKQIADFDARINVYKEKLEDLKLFPAALGTASGTQTLYELQRSNIPFADELKTQLSKYDDISRKYKGKYPEVLRTEEQLADLLERIQKAIETEIHKQEPTRWDLEKKRADLVEELKQTSISQKLDQDVESDYGIYKRLYDEMKVKLEQAITTRDLGLNASNQFIIIDPPLVPTVPTQPNRPMLILGGLAVGLFLGFLSVVFKELLDTTIRTPKDIESYQKPVIAFITESSEERLN
ncbi:MAG TPA: Wzz/FepE/Etk N-terminal domain-containing protein [Bacteroidota bacterium]|nr:Wzz/FepE/Etk N-terminal domain-containing protein [Bacteroidota bacterium]